MIAGTVGFFVAAILAHTGDKTAWNFLFAVVMGIAAGQAVAYLAGVR